MLLIFRVMQSPSVPTWLERSILCCSVYHSEAGLFWFFEDRDITGTNQELRYGCLPQTNLGRTRMVPRCLRLSVPRWSTGVLLCGHEITCLSSLRSAVLMTWQSYHAILQVLCILGLWFKVQEGFVLIFSILLYVYMDVFCLRAGLCTASVHRRQLQMVVSYMGAGKQTCSFGRTS